MPKLAAPAPSATPAELADLRRRRDWVERELFGGRAADRARLEAYLARINERIRCLLSDSSARSADSPRT